jgi:hypothetical protein
MAGHRHHQDNSCNFVGALNNCAQCYLASRVGLAEMSWFGFIVLPNILHDWWQIGKNTLNGHKVKMGGVQASYLIFT